MLKDFLDKFGLGEVFAHICPGLVLILSSMIWWRLEADSLLFKNAIGTTVVVVLLSYTLGLVVASYLSLSEGRYLLARYRFRKQGLFRRIPTAVVLMVCKFGAPRPDAILVDWTTEIASALRDLGAPVGLTQHIKSSERFGVFQAIARGNGMDDIIEEAQGYRRRAMFALGVGLALLVTACQLLLRIVLEWFLQSPSSLWPDMSWSALIVGSVVTTWTAIELRRVGMRMLAMEAYVSAFIAGRLSHKEKADSEEVRTDNTDQTKSLGP